MVQFQEAFPQHSLAFLVRFCPLGPEISSTYLPALEKHLWKIPDHDDSITIMNDCIVANSPVPIHFIDWVFFLEFLLHFCVPTGLFCGEVTGVPDRIP